MQTRMLNAGPLHHRDGRLTETGYAFTHLKTYDRSRVKAPRWRIKEWDYYAVCNDHHGIAFTIADNGYMGLASVSLLDFNEKTHHTQSFLTPFPMGRLGLPATSETGNSRISGKQYELNFVVSPNKREIYGHVYDFREKGRQLLFDLELRNPLQDSMVIATPFHKKPRHFYYNQKINCLPAQGRVILGDSDLLFSPASAFGVLDWGRGVWPYRNTWYWGSASGIVQGRAFGMNIGHGFGDTEKATENMLFYGGKASKLGRVAFSVPVKNGREDYLAPWQVQDGDGRLSLTFEPILDRAANMRALFLASVQHQVFGRFSGTAILDSGMKLEIRGLLGFLEKVSNRW